MPELDLFQLAGDYATTLVSLAVLIVRLSKVTAWKVTQFIWKLQF